MSDADALDLTTRLFLVLRSERHFSLGLAELLDGRKIAKQDAFRSSEGSLVRALAALWAKSQAQGDEVREAWKSLGRLAESQQTVAAPEPPYLQPVEPAPVIPTPPAVDMPPVDQGIAPRLSTLPIQAPTAREYEVDEPVEAYLPVTARQMRYAWRYLRVMAREGPRDEVDVDATVRKVCQEDMYLSPVLRRRLVNRAHLVLLIDQNGSMMPFHRFTRDFAATASSEDLSLDADCYYFRNEIGQSLWRTPYLTDRVATRDVLGTISADSSVLIVSDGGAARGATNDARIERTYALLTTLHQRTERIAWMNPMPRERWPGTTAGVLSKLVPMSQMDPDGLSDGIDAVRGLAATG